MPGWDELDRDLTITLTRIASLDDNDARTISATLHLHYCAALLASSDLTGAYALVVGGLETLAQAYGSPPSEWADGDLAVGWDAFYDRAAADSRKATALRSRLMDDKQIRLGERLRPTSRNACRQRFGASPSVNTGGASTLSRASPGWTVGGPDGRAHRSSQTTVVSSSGRSSGATKRGSRFIHAGERSVPFSDDLMSRIPGQGGDRLTVAALRAALRRVILTELEDRASNDELPPVEWRFDATSGDDSPGES